MTGPSSGNRSIGVVGAAAIGVGGMVGGGIFAVLGTAATRAGGGTPVAFLIAGLLAALTAYAYARLSVAFPSSGGTVVFLDEAFGVDLLTGSLNLVLWLSYLVTIALYASAFGTYGATFFDGGPPSLALLLACVGIALPAAINLLDSDIVSRSETVIVVIKLAILVLVIVTGLPAIDAQRLAPSAWEAPLALVVGGMVIFVAYEGFELIANAAGDVRDPKRTLPRAYFLCVGLVVLLYLAIAAVTVGTLTASEISAAEDYALARVAEPVLGHVGFVLVAVSALLATLSAINATIYGNARLGLALAKDGELPRLLERRTWSRPVSGVLVTSAIAMAIVCLVDLHAIAILGSAGFLLIFAFVNAAAFRLAPRIGAQRAVCGIATVACVGALVALLVDTGETKPKALIVFGVIVVGALAFELTYPRLTGRRLRFHRRREGVDG